MNRMPIREDILKEIIREKERLAEQKAEIKKTEARIHAFREELASYVGKTVRTMPGDSSDRTKHSPETNREKVVLFRSLFRGRMEVFPKRWDNPRSGKSGYSPACTNEWIAGLCVKKGSVGARKGKKTCGDCENQAFIPVSDEEVLKHLQGQQVMGVYPGRPSRGWQNRSWNLPRGGPGPEHTHFGASPSSPRSMAGTAFPFPGDGAGRHRSNRRG